MYKQKVVPRVALGPHFGRVLGPSWGPKIAQDRIQDTKKQCPRQHDNKQHFSLSPRADLEFGVLKVLQITVNGDPSVRFA